MKGSIRQCPAVSLRITRHIAASAAPLLTDTPAHILAAVTPDHGPRGTIQLFVLGRAVAKRGERRAAPRQNSSGAVLLSFRTQVFLRTYANLVLLSPCVRKPSYVRKCWHSYLQRTQNRYSCLFCVRRRYPGALPRRREN